MDIGIQLGDLEESTPEVRLRPDQNRHFSIAACFNPDDDDLPIFVDVDVMREIETHAQTNTNVELGGVLLGGQYVDADGNAFVEITDSLRAEHYEATRGSFKFTHETWEAITRQRDQFPASLQMVGWYHTHPDWGVFLSSMDMFICDNFFNRVLDVALVVDPCRDDRGWFQWTGDAEERVRRTGGFYLIGSRFREEEVQYFADFFSGESNMAANIRHTPVAGRVGSPPQSVVNIADRRGEVQTYVIAGMLLMQFLLLSLIAWQIFRFAPNQSVAGPAIQGQGRAIVSEDSIREQTRAELLKEIIAGVAPETGEKLAERLEDANQRASASQSDLKAQRIANDVFARQSGELVLELKDSEATVQKLKDRISEADQRLATLNEESLTLGQSIKTLQAEGVRLPIWKDPAMWTAGSLLALISALIGFGAAIGLRRENKVAPANPEAALQSDLDESRE